jgi:hypothetical protein
MRSNKTCLCRYVLPRPSTLPDFFPPSSVPLSLRCVCNSKLSNYIKSHVIFVHSELPFPLASIIDSGVLSLNKSIFIHNQVTKSARRRWEERGCCTSRECSFWEMNLTFSLHAYFTEQYLCCTYIMVVYFPTRVNNAHLHRDIVLPMFFHC